MEIVWLIVAVVVVLTASLGVLRAAARSWGALALELALLLGAAGACYLIGESKTGGYLAGIIGLLLCLLLLIAAGGLAAGAAGRWIADRLNPGPVKAPPAGDWDLWLLGVLSVLAVCGSAME